MHATLYRYVCSIMAGAAVAFESFDADKSGTIDPVSPAPTVPIWLSRCVGEHLAVLPAGGVPHAVPGREQLQPPIPRQLPLRTHLLRCVSAALAWWSDRPWPSVICNSCVALWCRNHDGKLSFEEFKELNTKFPMILFPAFQLQDEMQSATLGACCCCVCPCILEVLAFVS